MNPGAPPTGPETPVSQAGPEPGAEPSPAPSATPLPYFSGTPRPTDEVEFFDLTRPTVGSVAAAQSGQLVGPPMTDEGLFENPFRPSTRKPQSSFGMAVDISSYLYVQQVIFEETRLPDPADVRIEEMVNYFPYDYAGPDEGDDALAVRTDLASCPWSSDRVLLRIAVRARDEGGDLVAEDAKASVSFAPEAVASWRLIGFDGPLTAAGRRGAKVRPGSSLTALYELTLTSSAAAGGRGPVCTVSVDYKLPGDDEVRSAVARCGSMAVAFENADADFRFAASVAAFGMILRDSPHRGSWTAADVAEQAEQAVGDDRLGRRGMFISVLREARQALLPAE